MDFTFLMQLFLFKYFYEIIFYVSDKFYSMPNITEVLTIAMSHLLQTGTFHKYLGLQQI